MTLSLSIALLVTTILSLLLLLLWSRLSLQQMSSQNLNSLQVLNQALMNSQVMNQTLVNLLASKEPMTFQALQAMSPQAANSADPNHLAGTSTLSPNSTYDEVIVNANDEQEWETYQRGQGLSDIEIEHLKLDLQESGLLNFNG